MDKIDGSHDIGINILNIVKEKSPRVEELEENSSNTVSLSSDNTSPNAE